MAWQYQVAQRQVQMSRNSAQPYPLLCGERWWKQSEPMAKCMNGRLGCSQQRCHLGPDMAMSDDRMHHKNCGWKAVYVKIKSGRSATMLSWRQCSLRGCDGLKQVLHSSPKMIIYDKGCKFWTTSPCLVYHRLHFMLAVWITRKFNASHSLFHWNQNKIIAVQVHIKPVIQLILRYKKVHHGPTQSFTNSFRTEN